MKKHTRLQTTVAHFLDILTYSDMLESRSPLYPDSVVCMG